jgi:AmmeMemoRadiSam system protein B
MKTLLGHPNGPKTVLLFGADHVGTVRMGEVYASGSLGTPLGDVSIDADLANELLRACDLLRVNPAAHAREHSLEVQVPVLQQLVPGVKIVPIGIPVDPMALKIGTAIGKYVAQNCSDRVCIIGSTDMTHTGGHFGCIHHGPGADAEAYARANDARLCRIIENMELTSIIPEVRRSQNACGRGAVAATASAAA